jgi:hypothetical protein
LPDHWSITTRYEAKIDFENHFTTHAGKLSVGKQLKRPKVGLGLALKVPFNSRTNEYSLFLDATKYF